MEDINYADGQGHPARADQQRLAAKLLESFQQIIRRARQEAGVPALEESDVEAVGCEEACDAGAAATLERPPRSGAGAATRSPRASGSRVDVLDAADAYPGWERDLRSQHSVISKPISDSKKNKLSFHCELCDVPLPSWAQVQMHCKALKHTSKQKKGEGARDGKLHRA